MSVPLRILSHLIRPKIQHLILHVTDRCNLRCKHCFVDLTEKNTITVETARSLAGQIGRLTWLDIGGGEPFLLDELPQQIAPFACDVLGIPTNGHFPDRIVSCTEQILRTAQAKDIVIGVSIEGFREQHDAIRTHPKNYDLAFESLRALRDLAGHHPRLRVKCNTVITNKTLDGLIDFMHYMRESGLVDFHSVIMLRGNPYSSDISLPYIERLEELRPKIFEILDSYFWGSGAFKRAFLRRYYRFLWDVSLGNLRTGSQVIPCTGGQTHLVIWANGDVASCELLPPIGNIYRAPLGEILRGASLRGQVKSIRNKECSCTHNCVMLDSILFNPWNYPRLARA